MAPFKFILIAIIIFLSSSVNSFPSHQSSFSTSNIISEDIHEEYVYIKDILYHIVYDDDGNIISIDEVED
jgi:hypothetical protein